jgi:hypothetical protein
MRNFIYILLAIGIISQSNQVFSESSYICAADKATGFKFNTLKESWESGDFTTQSEKILLKKTDKRWEWVEFGREYGRDCGEINENGYLICSDIYGQFIFSKNTLRYTSTYIRGYVDGEDKEGNTPNLMIGKCTLLN